MRKASRETWTRRSLSAWTLLSSSFFRFEVDAIADAHRPLGPSRSGDRKKYEIAAKAEWGAFPGESSWMLRVEDEEDGVRLRRGHAGGGEGKGVARKDPLVRIL